MSGIRPFKKSYPQIAASAWIDDSAVVIGDITIGDDSSVWPMTVIRGDVNSITIGARSNIQDGSVLHVTHAGKHYEGAALSIGDDVTVGHKVILHACTIGDRCLIGMGAIIMDKTIIENDVIIGAGSLVAENKILQSGHLYLGSPAKKIRPLTERELKFLRYSAEHYVELAREYR
ncbi:MAG TPA: gamma carbonic anhydrase family protein [Gammaproteobacteria bacterium]|nr:gamma carbonic anhydrase family protein [Gammaproteobacteria bacterium]